MRRLMAMSPAEILHRAKEHRLRQAGRSIKGWQDFELADDAELAAFTHDLTRLTQLAGRSAGDWRRIYDRAKACQWDYLGRRWPGVTGPAVWHLDPVSGQSWPNAVYCFDVPYRHADDMGDVKYVWELNRLQFLPPIAALARVAGDDEARRYCLDTIFEWAEANPPFAGVNWASGIELALRAISMLVTLSLIGPDALTSAEKNRIGMVLNAHAFWLARYPSRFSSANNHLIAEAAGLFILGTLLPTLPDAVDHAAYGRRVLSEEIEKQILSDGVGAEQSPTYTAFTLELMLLARAVALSAGTPFPAAFDKRLHKAATFLRWITDDGGNQPRIGDDDEGRVIVSQAEHENTYVSSILSCLAEVTGAAELAPPIDTPHLRNVFLGAAPPHPDGPVGVRFFDTGGYSVFRQHINGRNVLLVFDHGPLGYLSIAAHGHADAMAVWLHVDGLPVLIDAGTYLYHSGGKMRDYFRGTRAHNTLTVNATDQSTISGPFNWSHKARAWRIPVDKTPDGMGAMGAHDGYKKLFGLVHERRVAFKNPDGYVIADRLAGTAKTPGLPAQIRYFVAPGVSLSQPEAHTLRLTRDGQLIAEIEMSLETARGAEALPLTITDANISPRFGQMLTGHVVCADVAVDNLTNGSARTRIRIINGP